MSDINGIHAHPAERFSIHRGPGGMWLIDLETGKTIPKCFQEEDDAIPIIQEIVSAELARGENYRPAL